MRPNASLFILALASAGPSAAQTPEIPYESAFSTYKPYEEPELAPWKEVNEAVAKAGGHIGIFGGAPAHAGHGAAASQPAAKPEPAKTDSSRQARPAPAKPSDPHAGH